LAVDHIFGIKDLRADDFTAVDVDDEVEVIEQPTNRRL